MFQGLSLSYVLIVIGVLLVSLTIHESMHAFAGLKLGDDTATEEGRISLNPLKHIDPFMTIVLPAITLILAGVPVLAAKPVPFNPDRVKFDEFGAAIIAAAGPVSNLILAVLAVIICKLAGIDVNPATASGLVETIAATFVVLNTSLFVFNLIPIPPLDGSRVLYAFAPEPLQRLMQSIEPYGIFIVFGLVLLTGFGGAINLINQSLINFLI